MTLAVNEVNKFIFSRPAIYNIFAGSPVAFTNAVEAPVYPINQQPEPDGPMTIYTWRTRRGALHYAYNVDEITYWIWDHDVARLQEYENQLRNYLGREDETAQAFNMWAMNNGGMRILMHWSRYAGSSDTHPTKQEGGLMGKSLTFTVQYIDCSKNNGPLDIT